MVKQHAARKIRNLDTCAKQHKNDLSPQKNYAGKKIIEKFIRSPGVVRMIARATFMDCRGKFDSLQDRISIIVGKTVKHCKKDFHALQSRLFRIARENFNVNMEKLHKLRGKLSRNSRKFQRRQIMIFGDIGIVL